MGFRASVLAIVALAAGSCSSTNPNIATRASGNQSSVLNHQLLSSSDLLPGWSIDNTPQISERPLVVCGTLEPLKSKAISKADAAFEQGNGVFVLDEELGTFADTAGIYQQAAATLAACTNFSITIQGKSYPVTMEELSLFPKIENQSAAFSIKTTDQGIEVGFIIVFRKGNTIAFVSLDGPGPLGATLFPSFVTLAADLITA